MNIPAHSETFEKNVIGSVLIDPTLSVKFAKCREDYFFCDEAKAAYRAIVAEITAGNAFDTVLILSKIPDKNIRAWVFSANNSVQTTATFDFYVAELRNLALKRELARVGMALQEDCLKSPEELATEIRTKIDELTKSNPDEKTKYQKLEAFIDELEDIKSRGAEMDFGMQDIDNFVNGLRRKRLYVIGGIPSSGKTGFALQIARRNAIHNTKKVLIFSLEISFFDAVGRLASSMLKIPAWKIQKPWFMDADEMRKMKSIVFMLDELSIEIVHNVTGISDIISKISEHKPDLVIIDHIQYLPLIDKQKSKFDKTHELLGAYLKKLRDHSIKENFCLLVLSQISRQHTECKGNPNMSWFQGSSGIEQHSDVATIIHYHDPTARHLPGLWLVKNRNGTGGVGREIKLAFDENYLEYTELFGEAITEVEIKKTDEEPF